MKVGWWEDEGALRGRNASLIRFVSLTQTNVHHGQASRHAGGRTGGQSGKQASKQASRQASRQAGKHAASYVFPFMFPHERSHKPVSLVSRAAQSFTVAGSVAALPTVLLSATQKSPLQRARETRDPERGKDGRVSKRKSFPKARNNTGTGSRANWLGEKRGVRPSAGRIFVEARTWHRGGKEGEGEADNFAT